MRVLSLLFPLVCLGVLVAFSQGVQIKDANVISEIPMWTKSAGNNVNLYITFHGGKPKDDAVNTVLGYPLSGGGNGNNVLHAGTSLRELRGMALLPDGSLLLNNAYKDDSKVAHYSKCTGSDRRSFIEIFTAFDSSANPGLNHPYGVAVSPIDGNVYVSNQDSNSVTRYSLSNGQPLPLPPALANGEYNPGTFAQYDPSSNGVRGITFDSKGNLYVASEDTNQVTGYNSGGYSFLNISVNGPVGVFFETATNLLYIGSKSDNTVRAYNLRTGRWNSNIFSDSSLSHPAGIAVDTPSNTLYVVNQDANSVLSFNTQTGQSYGAFVSNLPDAPECLLLSPC